MNRNHKLTRKDFELLQDPVWTVKENRLEPTPFFHDWWQAVAENKGRTGGWTDAAVELGYLSQDKADPIGFSYDPVLYRDSLGLPQDMPIVLSNASDANAEAQDNVWEWLLRGEV